MKIESGQEQLLDAIQVVEKVSGKNLTLPVLNCIFLSAKDNHLTLKATNLDLGVEMKIPVKIEDEGEVAVPGSVLLNTLSTLYEGKTVTLSVKDGNLIVKTGSGTTTIKAQPHDDFPTIPQAVGAKHFGVKASVLLEGLRAVWYSASVSSVKPELSSVYVYPYDKKVYFVATDSFRLAEKSVPVKGSVPEFDALLIPFKNITEIIRVLERVEDEVRVSLTQNQISFSYGTLYLTSRLIDGSFPDYKQIIPKEKTTEVVVLKQDFINVLKKTTVFSDNFNQVRIKLDPEKKVFTVSSKNNDVGETVDNVHASLSGEPLEISFNYKYIVDAFQALHTDSITLSFSGLSRPMIMQGSSDTSFLYLVMPMNK